MGHTILVTGASGFLGSRLQALAAAGWGTSSGPIDWVFTDRVAPRPGANRQATGRFDLCDLSDLSQVERLLADSHPNSVVHLAGAVGGGSSIGLRETLFRANLMSTCNLLEGLRSDSLRSESLRGAGAGAAKCPHFVLASTGLIYGDQHGPFSEDLQLLPPNDYSLTKMLAETALKAYAQQGVVRACILRPAVLYGPGQGGDMFVPALISSLRNGQRFPMTAGAQRRDFVYIDDAVEAVRLVTETEREGTYNVGSGRGISIREIGEVIAGMLGRPDLLGLGDLPYRQREVWEYVLDASRLRDAGWTPATEIIDGLRNTVRWGSETTT